METQNSPQVVPSWLPRELFPFESKFIDIDGHSLHYVDEGVGPTLLLLHGNPTWSFLYRDIITRLRHKFRCVALDYPGFGLSHAAIGYDFLPSSHAHLVDSFVHALNLTQFSIMVQDWGGPIGLWVAARHASQVSALIIGNTWAWPINGDPHFERFSKMMGGSIGLFAIRNFNAFVNIMIPMGVKRKKLNHRVMAAYRCPFPTKDTRLPTNIFPREIRSSREFLADVQTGLSEIPRFRRNQPLFFGVTATLLFVIVRGSNSSIFFLPIGRWFSTVLDIISKRTHQKKWPRPSKNGGMKPYAIFQTGCLTLDVCLVGLTEQNDIKGNNRHVIQ
jgi:haloalkane dehalogenase